MSTVPLGQAAPNLNPAPGGPEHAMQGEIPFEDFLRIRDTIEGDDTAINANSRECIRQIARIIIDSVPNTNDQDKQRIVVKLVWVMVNRFNMSLDP